MGYGMIKPAVRPPPHSGSLTILIAPNYSRIDSESLFRARADLESDIESIQNVAWTD